VTVAKQEYKYTLIYMLVKITNTLQTMINNGWVISL